jgi:uncharacterized glyoxalase superfamily protein PhnB
MRLVQARIVTDDVAALAAFYARLVGAGVALNEYYVEVPTPSMSIGFSRRRFTEHSAAPGHVSPAAPERPGEMILDFEVEDADAEYQRIAALGVTLVMPPTTQPWGNRSMICTDPEGNLINVFSRPKDGEASQGSRA